jgi:L-rhamnose mutarotase
MLWHNRAESQQGKGPVMEDPDKATRSGDKRYGMVTGLRPEKMEGSKRLHADAWPGVLKMIRECNSRDQSSLLREVEDGKCYLFIYFEYVGEDF